MALIASFTDLHYRQNLFAYVARIIGEGTFDAVCLTGDFLDQHPRAKTPLPEQVNWVLDWFDRLPRGRTRVLAVTGNHDCWPRDDAGAWLQRARRPGVAVDGDIVRVGGVTFVCQPWLGEIILPDDKDVVLLAHGAPEGTELAQCNRWDAGGDVSTRMAAEELHGRNALVLCGHVHLPDSWVAYVLDVAALNPGSQLTARIPRHVIVDTKRRRAHLVTEEGIQGPICY